MFSMYNKRNAPTNDTGSDLLSDLIGKKVIVIGHNDGNFRDEGVLEGFDGTVLYIRSKNPRGRDRHLYFPVRNIRLIEILDEQ